MYRLLLSAFLIVGGIAPHGEHHCTDDENRAEDKLNPGCNLAGRCTGNSCICCSLDLLTLEPSYSIVLGEARCPGWSGGHYEDPADDSKTRCSQLQMYTSEIFKYYFSDGRYLCAYDHTTFLGKLQEYYASHGYTGVFTFAACNECSPSSPCEFVDPVNARNSETYTSGLEMEFHSDFHSFYDNDCGDDDTAPRIYKDTCPANYDFGYLAKQTFERARRYRPSTNDYTDSAQKSDMNYLNDAGADAFGPIFHVFNTQISASSFIVNSVTAANSIRTERPTQSPTTSPTPSPTEAPTQVPTKAPTQVPTKVPTQSPTESPTEMPTPEPDCLDLGYTNQIADLKYMGAGSTCRGGIEMKWPGGKGCNSPYIVCLPAENTPNQEPKDPFFDNKHRYSVEECKYECAWDQRCRGFEFVPRKNQAVGSCKLIDDLPIVIEDPEDPPFVYDSTATNLMNKTLCFSKEDYCNPYFEAEDLSPLMLSCYCPNNRKGFYTKKVKRTVENTRFCNEEDPNLAEINLRIKHAQANRMFHLCENWCLFNTFKPEHESWYWNPWLKCWREQYAGIGPHRSYCNRVIRNPDTIEQYFINYRTENFCDPMSQMPTQMPTDIATQWVLSNAEESCIDACEAIGQSCDEAKTASLDETVLVDDVHAAFLEAGVECNADLTGVAMADWAAPAAKGKRCYIRNSTTGPETGCQWPVGDKFKRLCACTDADLP